MDTPSALKSDPPALGVFLILSIRTLAKPMKVALGDTLLTEGRTGLIEEPLAK